MRSPAHIWPDALALLSILYGAACSSTPAIVSSPPGSYLIVLQEHGGIAQVEPNSGWVKQRADSAPGDHVAAVSGDGCYVAVASEAGRLSVRDLDRWPFVTQVDLAPDAKPCGATFLDRRTSVLVACTQGSELVLVNQLAGKVERRIALDDAPNALGVSPELTVAYVASSAARSVAAIDIESGQRLARVVLDATPTAMTTSSRTGEVWIALASEPRIVVLAGRRLEKSSSIACTRPLSRLASTPDGATIVGCDADSAALSIFDVAEQREVARVDLGVPGSSPTAGRGPPALVIDYRGRFAIVTGPGNELAVVDLGRRARTGAFATGDHAAGLVWRYRRY